MSDIEGDTHANDPGSPDYTPSAPSWVGKDFTFNGGVGHDIAIRDDDGFFEDGYVETGGAQTLIEAVTINGVTYPAGSAIENEFSLIDDLGNEIYVIRINNVNVGFVYAMNNEPSPGQTFTSSASRDGDGVDSADGQTSSARYSTIDSREGIVHGTQGADMMDGAYTGDPEGDKIDDGIGAGPNGNADVIYAEGGNDTVHSGAGDDTVYGGLGNDSIGGGAGSDSLDGGAGADAISGGDGNDTIGGGEGNDTLSGDMGHDRIGGDAGDDSIIGGAGSDTLGGGAGADTIRGGADNDFIEGGAGNDHLYDDGGADTVYGGEGDDTLHMGAGNDSLHGGTGSDYFIANDGFGSDTVTGGEDPNNAEYDFLDFRGHTQSVNVTYAGFEEGSVTAGTDTVTFTEIEAIWLSNQSDYVDASVNTGFTGIGAGAGNDTVITGSGDDIVIGEAGNDSIEGNAGNDTIDGGVGSDTIFGGAGADSLYGGGGIDRVRGGEGNDQIYGGTENDKLYGDGGSDLLYGETGDDRVEGGAGDDLIDGGEGNDTLHGDGGNDIIAGSGGDDAIFGGDGSDTVGGGAGSDRLIGGQGADSVEGGDGNDYLQGDSSTGTSQTDLQSGGNQTSSTEADGSDTLSGGAGNDTLHGGGGNDLLTGGAGNDFFYVSEGHDTVTDFNAGNTGALGDGNTQNNDFLNLGAYYDSLDELRADQADDGILNQSNTYDDEGNLIDYSDNAQFGSSSSMTVQNADNSTYSYDNTGIVCFSSRTQIMTPQGEVAIESLKPGDLVNTLDHGPQPLLWIGQRHINNEALVKNKKLRPVLIPKRALGSSRDLLVSRQHGVMVGNNLVRAIDLVGELPGVRIANGKRKVSYFHLFFEQHEILFAEGIGSESFYPGPQAMKMLSNRDRLEVSSLISGMTNCQSSISAERIENIYGRPARRFLELNSTSRDDRSLFKKKISKLAHSTRFWDTAKAA